MLTKGQYRDIAKNWVGTVYQKYDRYQVRFPTLLKHLDVFKGKNVLEVGCNAGLAGYHIAQVAKEYVGVEEQKDYYNQALQTKKHIDNKDAEFLNMSIKTYMKRINRGKIQSHVNAAYLSYVLYHFSDKEVEMFEKYILPKLDVIVVQSRYAKRNKKGRRKHNSYGFWDPKNVVKFLQKNGFETTLAWGPDKKFHFIVGIKNSLLYGKNLPNFELGNFDKISTLQKEEIKEEIHEATMARVKSRGNEWAEHKAAEKENTDGDKGSSEVHKEGEGEAAEGRGTRSRKRRVAEGKPRSGTGRKADTKGKGRAVRSKNKANRAKNILQPGVEESPKEEVRDKDIQKVEKTKRRRRSTKTVKDSSSEDKPTV